MKQELVSIAMCTYNGERFLKEQLDSILNQTYKNLELIITDDCSTDTTTKIIHEYKKTDNRIKIYSNEENLGFVKNFEKAISLCTGNYIALADQDDIWKINKIELFINKIADNVLIYSDSIVIDTDGNDLGSEFVRPNSCLVSGNINKAFFLLNCVSGNTLMFKKELVQHIIPIPPTVHYHDSWIAFVASTYGTINYTDESMTYYRRYEEQITNQAPVTYKSFSDKLGQKKEAKLNVAKDIINNLEAYSNLKILKDKDTIKIIQLLKEHYLEYEHIYFNKSLYKMLKKYREEIFAITKSNKRKKRTFRTSLGLKLRAMTLYKL